MAETKKKTMTPASESAAKAEPKKAAKKTADAEPEKKTATKKAATKTEKTMTEAAPVGNAKGLRWGAVAMWLAALGLEVVALFLLIGKINIPFLNSIPTLYQALGALVLDFVLVVWGAQLWKKANHIDPVSEKNKLKWWLWDNMGVIACAFCFVPFIVLVLTNKDLDQKSKTVATAAAAVLCVIGGLCNYDWNPVSEEMKNAAMDELGNATVYWTKYGKVYHTHDDCQALNQSDSLIYGNVEEAIAANRSRLCKFCAKMDGIEDVATND